MECYKEIKTFLDGEGRLTAFPAKRKKKIIALFLCLVLLSALLVPVLAVETTDPTQPTSEYTSPAGSDVMLVICLIGAIAGGIYLIFQFKNSGRRR